MSQQMIYLLAMQAHSLGRTVRLAVRLRILQILTGVVGPLPRSARIRLMAQARRARRRCAKILRVAEAFLTCSFSVHVVFTLDDP